MPFALALQGFIGMNRYYGSLDSALISYNQLTWLPLLMAALAFLPEYFMGGGFPNVSSSQQMQAFGAEFLLTRAVDRACVFRCRGALFWAAIGIAVLAWLVCATFKPSFELNLPAHGGASIKAEYYLKNIPGSFVEKTSPDGDVTIKAPLGNLQSKAVMGVVLTVISAVWVTVLPIMARLRYRRWIYWGAFILGVAVMPWLTIGHNSAFEPIFVFGLANLPLCVCLAVILALGAQWFVVRKLSALEFM